MQKLALNTDCFMRKAFLLMLLMPFLCYSQNKVTNSVICKQKTIEAAQLADKSYTYSKMAYFISNSKLAQKNIDSSIQFIIASISALDSAIMLASDSELMGKNFATISRNSAKLSLLTLRSYAKYSNSDQKKQLAEDATQLSANTVIDAYHASFYFKDALQPKQAEPAVVKKDTLPKQITKLDIDQALFALLDEELIEKEEKNKKEILKLETQLKSTKDPAKEARLKAEIKKIEQNEAEVEKQDLAAKQKLNKINAELDERGKGKLVEQVVESNAFSKSRPADDWERQVLPESEIPMGLVYQVQIGVYKNPVTAETFKGITPIFSKTTAIGITYSAGIFEKFSDAKQAKEYVLSMGLHDAFVISYQDRKRITLAEAAKLEKK